MDKLKFKLVYDRKKTAVSANKLGLIEVYVYDAVSRKKTYVSTGVEVTPSQFSAPKGEVAQIVKHPNKVALNKHIEKIRSEIEAFAVSSSCQSIEDVKNWNAKPEGNGNTFIDFVETELERRNPPYQSLVQHRTLIKRLNQFGRIKTFEDLTYANVVDFYSFLQEGGEDRGKLSNATLRKRHSMLQSYVLEAMNRGIITHNPCSAVKLKKAQTKDPVYLTEEELEAIENCPLEDKVEGERLLRVRDVFVFQCYTGLAYVDLKAFRKEHIFEINGQKVIRSNRQKTEQGYVTVLLPEAIRVLEKYNYELPVISAQKYNDYLKLLALYAVDKDNKPIIKKTLTSHVARHTCGTFLINRGVPLETVSRVLGHSNTKMTRHYARLLGKTVVDDVVAHVLNGNKKSPE